MAERRKSAASAAKKQRGKPFTKGCSGNPRGRRPGTRNHSTVMCERLMSADCEEITKAVVAMAKGGNLMAAKIIMDRLVPPRRDRPCEFDLPKIATAADAAQAMAVLLAAVAKGDVTPGEAAEIAKLIETFTRTLEIADLEARVARLEEVAPK